MAEGATPSRLGEILKGKYRLDELLGVGGMGEVYRAYNVMVDRTVAIKLLRSEFAQNAHVVERFMREAKASNVVQHRNIVDVLDIDKDDRGVMFIVEEYLEGEEFATRIEDGGALPPEEVLSVVVPVAEAVGEAHKKGVVHRDLKPENIFLTLSDLEEIPKVLDFGISKLPLYANDGESGLGAGMGSFNPRLTAAGGAMGTPTYMSPEQIKDSASVDARSDVWSLGVILYEALAGALPFESDTLGGLFAEICSREPAPLHKVAEDVPRYLARVVHRCLQPDPRARYANAIDLAAALTQCVERLQGGEQAVPGDSSVPPPHGARRGHESTAPGPDRAASAAATARIEGSDNPDDWELELPVWSLPPASTAGKAGPSNMPSGRPPPPPMATGDSAFGVFDDDSVASMELELDDQPPPTRSSAPGAHGASAGRWSVPPSVERRLKSRSTPPAGMPAAAPGAYSKPPAAIPAVVGGARSRPPNARQGSLPPGGRSVPPGGRSLPPDAAPRSPRRGAPSQPPAEVTASEPPTGRSVSSDAHMAVPSSGPPRGSGAPRARKVSQPAEPTVSAGDDLQRAVGAAVLAVVVGWWSPLVSPRGLLGTLLDLGGAAYVLLPAMALVLLGGAIWVLVYAFRWASFSLFLTTLALVVLAACSGAATVALGAPGSLRGTLGILALISGPWAGLAALSGFVIYFGLRLHELRGRPAGRARSRTLALSLSILVCVAAMGWILLQPWPGPSDVVNMSAPAVEARTIGPGGDGAIGS